MSYTKKIKLLLIGALFILLVFNSGSNSTYAATKVELSHSSLVLHYGSTVSISMKGTKERVVWSSSNNKVASVSSNGRIKANIKAKREGKATITARIGKKKYTCNVEVLGPNPQISYIADREVSYYSETDSHKVFFSMLDEDQERTYGNMQVDIKIINSNNEKVYEKTHYVRKKDYAYWNNSIKGSRYLASIDIPNANITKGSSETGTVYITVSGQNAEFDEYSLAMDDLPYISAADKSSLELPKLPKQLNNYSWRGNLDGILKITNIKYRFEESYDDKVKLTVDFEGERIATGTNDAVSRSLKISYKLFKDGYVVDSGTTYVPSLNIGEKFKGEQEVFYSLEPGEYVLELFNTR